MSEKDYIENKIFSRDLPSLNNILKNIFIKDDFERAIINKQTDIDNFNELRLRMFFIYSKTLTLCSPVYKSKIDEFLCQKEIDKESTELGCWKFLSKLIEKKEAIGFPLLYKHIEYKNIIRAAFETNISKSRLNSIYDYTFSKLSRLAQIKFQKLLISYTLYTNNISYNNLFYDIYIIPDTDISFKINNLYFRIKLTTLVILSPKTYLMLINNINLITENVYINDVLEFFREKTTYNFMEYIIINFSNFIDISNIPSYSNVIGRDTENIGEFPKRGSLIKFRNNDKFNYGILVDYYDADYKIYFFSEDKTKKSNFIQSLILPRSDIFKTERIAPITNIYIIGDSDSYIELY